jgi:hypothetical protein
MKKLLWILSCVVAFYAHAQTPLQIVKEDYKKKRGDYEYLPVFGAYRIDLANYLFTHITYTESARLKKIEGDMLVAFEVTDQGITTNVRILKELDPELDSLVKEVFLTMPRWRPAVFRSNKDFASVDILLWIIFALRSSQFFNLQEDYLFGIGISGLNQKGIPFITREELENPRKGKVVLSKKEESTVAGRQKINLIKNSVFQCRINPEASLETYMIDRFCEHHMILDQLKVDTLRRKKVKYTYQKTVRVNYEDIKEIVYRDQRSARNIISGLSFVIGSSTVISILIVPPFVGGGTKTYSEPGTWIVFAGGVGLAYLGYQLGKNIKSKRYDLVKDWSLQPVLK